LVAFLLSPQLASALFALMLFSVALTLIIRAFGKNADD
jgi:hypothetical protein